MELFPIKTISESALQSNDHSSDSIRDDLKAFLKTQKEIRILVANSSGYGNQSGSVNILRQLIDGGWNDGNKKGTLYVLALYYANVTERMEQIGKMQVLIPQFKNLDEVFELNEAPVKVVELGPGTQLQPQTLFGITGGWDDKERPTEKVLEQLNVTTYLQLQVYAWTKLGSNQVWFKTEKKTWEKNNLDETEPNPYLARRTLYLNDPLITPSDWSSLFTSGFKNQAKIVQYLLSNELPSATRLCPAYGLSTLLDEGVSPFVILYNAAASILYAQQIYKIADASIIVLLENLSPRDWNGFQLLVKTPEMFTILQPSPLFLDWHKKYAVSTHVKSIGERGKSLTLEEVKNQVEKLKMGDVLVIYLGNIPKVLFDSLHANATLPPIFEGQGTTEVMLNLGKSYFKDNRRRPDDVSFSYPTLPIATAFKTPGIEASKAEQVARTIFTLTPAMWNDKEAYGTPTEQLWQMIQTYVTSVSSSDLRTYFKGLEDFFHNKNEDKLFIGLRLYRHILIQKNLWPNMAKRTSTEVASPLEQFYNDLRNHIQNNVLYYLEAVTTGLLHTFFAGIVTDGVFQIDNANVTMNSEGTEVTLVGKTQAFGVGNTDLYFRFNAPNNAVVAHLIASFTDLSWSFAGAQWLSIGSQGLTVTLDQDSISAVVGAFTARVSSGFTMDVTIPFASNVNRLSFQGNFTETRPSFTSLFQMVGGINLQALLPSPLQGRSAHSTIEVLGFLFSYNLTTGTMEYIGINVGTSPDTKWPLVPGVEITGLSFSMTISRPADLRQLSYQISGQFAIGDGTAFINAFLPDLRVSGGLVSDSKPVSLASIIKKYLGDQPLPHVIGSTSIDALTFVLDQPTGIYSFSMSIQTSWPIEINGTNVFEITELDFAINAVSKNLAAGALQQSISNATAGDTTIKITGSFSGQTTILPDNPDRAIALSLFASYLGSQQGWRFEAMQTSGKIAIADLLETYLHWDRPPFQLDIDGLGLTIETATNSFEFAGRVTGQWNPPIQDGITFSGELRARIGYNGGSSTLGPELVRVGRAEMPVLFADDYSVLFLPSVDGKKKPGWFGEVSLELTWNGVDLTLFYNFDPQYKKFGITWGILTGAIEQKVIDGKEHQIATLQFTASTTLGSMVEIMVSWLTGSKFGLGAPWNILNSISLNKLALVYDFTASKVSFDIAIGPIEMGFARIESISLSYNSGSTKPDENGVIVTLKGSFRWQTDPQKPLSWDAARPEKTEGPPGGGNKYLDLRLLAMGQHVTVTELQQATTVQQAIKAMETLPIPDPEQIPLVKLDADSSWLIGADFGVLKLEQGEKGDYFLTLQIVFNDPHLYGLRLALAGKPAKILAGLDFQILYRQVSETVGVYQVEITLPDVMRRLSVGAYTITLPVFGIALYTNGDFQIDLGFPWNLDFSRSFTIEAIIYPGIPLLGSAGLYFGKLSSATTNRVPATTKGLFNPVLVFGFGAQVGFGKSLEYGVFKAGFSLTIVGILEGVIAKWNPYKPVPTLPQVSDTQVQGEYYFWLRGTLGIVGKLYGTIDFSVVKADVNVQIMVLVQITFESYEPIVLTVLASVDVSVTLRINLGLFKINIYFTFSLQVKETFSILTSGTAPWSVGAAPLPGLLRAPLASRLLALQESLGLVSRMLLVPNWSNLLPADEPLALSGYLTPAFTMAGDAAASPNQQQACAVAMLFIRSVPPVTQDTHTSAQKAQGLLPDTSFEILCKQILRWAIASIQDRPMPAKEVDQQIVTDVELLSLFDFLISGDFPLPLTAIEAFLRDQFLFTIQLPPQKGESDATFFPMALSLELNIPDYGDWQGYTYTFADYNAISADFLANLRTYFNELAVQVQRESGTVQTVLPALSIAGRSVASFVFGDYFLLLCRQLVQAARAALRDFTYPIPVATTVDQIINWVNEAGDLNNTFTVYDLFAANPTHLLNPQRSLTIGENYTIEKESETFTSISTDLGAAFAPTELALTNAIHTTLLRPGAQIRYPGQPDYTIQAGDDLLKVARYFAVNLADLIGQAKLLEQEGLFQLLAPLFLPYVTYQALATDSFDGIARLAVYGGAFNATRLALQNAGRNILRPGAAINYPDRETYHILPGDCLGDLARHFGVSLASLLANTDILTRSDVLAAAAVLAIPPFVTSTISDDTLQGMAARFNTTIAVLAASPANLSLVDLFDDTSAPYLDLPHLPQFRVAELIAEIQRSLGLQQLSGMTSRYYLHGMRLPTAGITPKHRGMWVKEEHGTLTLPERAGLYALIGQQFPLPVIENKPFTVNFKRPPDLSWLAFAGENPDQLTITIAPDSLDNQRLQAVRAYARANRLDVALTELGREAQVTSAHATYPFTSSLTWQSAATLTLPYGKQPTGVSALRLWKLPVALTNLPDLATRAVNPRFSARVARYDEASGATINEDITSYGWASTIEFTVKKLPAPKESSTSPKRPALKTSYEVVGAGGGAIVLLERLLSQVRDDESLFADLLLGYPPDQTGDASQGIQTDAPGSVTMGIAQVNLSTETRPPTTLTAIEAGPTLLNSRSEFLRLLWEASITRAGGFYLYYYNADSAGGLPERIFNDKGEATVTLIVLYSKPPAPYDQNRLTDFMNALATAEPIDTAQAVVFAEANPIRPKEKIPARPTDTLARLAYRYYGDVGELAQDNAEVPLTPRTLITITQGVYEVPPAGVEPGGDLARIATHFGTTVQAIKDANPRIATWPDPLPLFMAIRLPRIEVLVGSSPGGDTLGQLARFYGEALTALAAENQQTPGLFAAAQPIVIAGGPTVSSPTVPAGVLAIETRRPVPPPVPDEPTDSDYGRLFLLHMYTLLSYQVSENAEFLSSAIGLPAGPATASAQSATPGKIRVPGELVPGDPWDYRQALPYPNFVKQVYRMVDGLPDPAQSPYRALGRLLQLDFAWQDLYGNRLITTLSNPAAGDQGPLNQPPLLTGYTDLLVGLSQWPSISTGWQVLPDLLGGLPRLELPLSFDDSQYQGLLVASAGDATTLLLRFTTLLDPQTAVNLKNYQIDKNISIQDARLLIDGETVELTISPLLEEEDYTLTIGNIETRAGDLTFSGQASFSYPDDPNKKRSSTVQEHAERDLLVYTQLYYQLTDPNGTALAIQTSLLKDGTIPLLTPVVAELLAWIGTLYTFLADRAQANNSVPVPEREHIISSKIDLARLNENQVFELTLALQITRTRGVVAGDLATVSGIRQVSTIVAPLIKRIEEENDTLGLTAFARQFQEALSIEGAYRLKVATGVDRFRLSPSQTGSTLWAVRLGLSDTDTTGIYYTIDNPGAPAIFAPRPISNTLENRMQVPIYDYISGQGIDFDVPDRFIDFAGIDMDLWVRQFFAAIDGVLTPEFTAAIQIVDSRKQETYLPDLLTYKKALAHLASGWMIPVFADEQVDSSTIQQVFEQQMLQQLSNAYTTRAGIQFQAHVRADIQKGQEAQEPARLLGTIVQNETSESAKSKVTLTSPKLTLQTGKDRLLAFLLTAPDIVTDAQGQVVSNLMLDLTYHGSQIEHQIGALPGIENYLASSWLSFVIPETGRPLDDSLGRFPVPLVLRSYPDSPTMVEQLGDSPEVPGEMLDQLTRWNYHFTYALPFHYPQDKVYGGVRFNVRDTLQSDFLDAFKDLAEFITVFPDVNKDLIDALATIDASTTDQGVIDKAAIALASFNAMVEHVVQAAEKSGGLYRSNLATVSHAQLGMADQSYAFTIQEGCIQQDGVAALLVMLHGQPPKGVAAPQVLIDPEIYDVQPFACNGLDCSGDAIQGDFCFWYRHHDSGQPLSAIEGQSIPDRQVLLKRLDVLAYQDAEAFVSLRRNEKLVSDRPSAEPFIYTTGRVTFANPFHPTIDSGEQVINIETIGSGIPPRPITRSFEQHMTALFAALLKDNTQPSLTIQMEIHYDYAIHTSLSPVPLAILLQPPQIVSLAGQGSDTLAQMITTWQDALQRWGAAYAPRVEDGVLWFDLTIMSELTSQPMPLLRLRLLRLPLQYIETPLWHP